MCLTSRGAVFFMASIHIFFSVAQFIYTLPIVVGQPINSFQATLSFCFCVIFFASGFMTFRGADEGSATLIRIGGITLFGVTLTRFILISFSLMLVNSIPEAYFLDIYNVPALPIVYTILLYGLYLGILFIYYKELEHEDLMLVMNSSK